MSFPPELAIDANHPAIKDYLTLVRLQVLTPLLILINVVTIIITAFIPSPTIGTISKKHPTPISPSPNLLGIYFLALFVTEIGYCLLLVITSDEATKQAVLKAVGYPLIYCNGLMAGWAVAWVILTALLLYINVVLLVYHAPTRSRFLDLLFIHAPCRLLLVLVSMLLLPQSIFIMTGKTWDPVYPPEEQYQWLGFAVVITTNVIGTIIVAIRQDVVWCVGALWINICMLMEGKKSAPVNVIGTLIAFAIIQPLALIGSLLVKRFSGRRTTGPIALPVDDRTNPDEEGERVNHQRNVERVWG
ncbi:hypothetical protein Clacol_008869 [Clathrus columnatus]|uniref:Uncharacterized protein n=1 Tax=Clathrus columnatus TaxID=1419009 RepID=A0AAV5ANF9_9AGAM|nr:hypothetical protein Clacol_008869 [Clathrus columnatus]